MGKSVIKTDTYADALEAVIAKIKARSVDLSVRHILLVPEKDTLKCEKMLFGGSGAFDVEVLSLSRWFYKLGGSVLPKTGAIMLLKDILEGLELKCFFRSKSFEGFCRRLYETVCVFDEFGVDPSQPAQSGALGLKLDDLARISAEFKRRTSGMHVDKAGKIRLVAERVAAGGILDNTHVYAASFGRLSPAERDLFALIQSHALSFTTTEVTAPPQIHGNIEVYRAAGAVSAIKAAAGRVIAAAKKGISMEEMCVVIPPQNAEQCRRIFSEAGIPIYIDKSLPTAGSSAGRFITLLLGLKRLSRTDMIGLAKNPFSGICPQAADVFEVYCKEFLVDYLGFSRPFTMYDYSADFQREQARLAVAEGVRSQLFGLLSQFWDRLNAAKSTGEFTDVIRGIFEGTEDAQVSKILGVLDTMDSFLSYPSESVFSKMCGQNEVAATVASLADLESGDKDGSLEGRAGISGGALSKKRQAFLISTFTEGLCAESLSVLPRTQGCILAGDAGIFKGERFRFTAIIGFNEGSVPALKTEEGLFSAAECALLAAEGAEMPDDEQENRQREYEFMQLLTVSDSVFLSFSVDSQSRPSPLLYEILMGKAAIKQGSTERDRLALEFGDDDELLQLCYCKSAAEELLAPHKNGETRLTATLKILLPPAQKYNENAENNGISSDLFFRQGTVSASQLRTYFACPYKHFAEYGLRARSDKSGEASVLDVGSAVHKVIELYAGCDFDESRLEELTNRVLSTGVYALKQNRRQRDRLFAEIMRSAAAFGKVIKRGKFENRNAEKRFGLPPNMSGVDIGGVMLKGAIDLYDSYQGYARVIDYKTGHAELSARELYYGKAIQLPLYMRVLRENSLVPAAMLYFEFKSKFGGQNQRFSGVYLRSLEVLEAFDPLMDGENYALPAKVKATKSGTRITGKGAVDEQTLNDYIDYAVAVSSLAVSQIKGGEKAANPIMLGSSPCKYCDYSVACGFCGAYRESGKVRIGEDSSLDTEDDL